MSGHHNAPGNRNSQESFTVPVYVSRVNTPLGHTSNSDPDGCSNISATNYTPRSNFVVHVAVSPPGLTMQKAASGMSTQFPAMMTPADTDRRVALSPPQSASEYASSSPLCCQRNQNLALGFPTRYLPNLLTRSMSRTDSFVIAQHTCIDANLRSGRSCDKKLIRATNATYFVTSPPVVTRHLRSVTVVTVTHAVPCVLGLALSLFTLILTLASITSCIVLILLSMRDSHITIQGPSICP